jgi:hypothetical protein
MNRTSMIVVVCLGLAILLSIGGAVWWWKANSNSLIEAAKNAYTDGKKMGSDLDEKGCLAAAVTRHKIKSNQSLIESTRTGLTLSGCLAASKLSDGFCEGVPSPKNPLDTSIWSTKTCTQQGLVDSACASVMQQVVHYCSQPVRAQKLKKPGRGDQAS